MAPIQQSQNASSPQDDHNDDVRIIVATQEHREDLLRLMRDAFLPREPVEVALGTTWEEAGESFAFELDDCLRQPCSFVAVHPTEGVIGCRVSRFIRIDPEKGEDMDDIIAAKGEAPSLRLFQVVADKLMRGYTKELAQRGCRTALQFINLCVEERFTGRGLAKRMIDESTRLAERLRVDCIFALATNHISQRVLQKSGFAAWRSLNYAEIINEETGYPFVVPSDGSAAVKWMVKLMTKTRQAAYG